MLEARLLTKYYEHTAAVRGVSFIIRPGQILGYLGPNGAGKSTTVKMLTGLIEPSEGQILYGGRSVHDDFTAFQRRIGYVPEEAHLYPHLTGREYLQLCGRLRGMPRRVLEPKMDEFLRAFGLWNDRYSPLSSYSKGMRQKILLSAALLHDPEILILDEPFSGLDVTSALMLRRLMRSFAKRGKIVLYSSHVLETVEKVCSQVLILRKGEVAAHDSIDRLRELMQQPSLEGVFAQLVEVDDGEELADRIVGAMAYAPPDAPAPPVAVGLRVYHGLAQAFPQEFQNVYGPELIETGEDAIEPVWRRNGIPGLVRLLLDIAMRLPVEYAAECAADVRYAFRRLMASPGFTVVALLSLAMGICIVTTAFSQMGMTLRDTPGVAQPRELVGLGAPVSFPDYRRYSAQGDLFSSTLAYIAAVPFGVTVGERTEREWGQLVTPSYFATLGTHPATGRFFDVDTPAGTIPVIVSNRFWREQLASDAAVVGRTIQINSQPATIIGVGPKDFLGAAPVLFASDLWLPLSVGANVAPELADDTMGHHDRPVFRMVGRLNPGIGMARAESELDGVARQIERDYGDPNRDQSGRRVTLVEGGKLFPLRKQDLPFLTSFFLIISSLVMLIACANLANMMLARAAGRRKEIGIRLALGASRARIVRQLLTESLLIAMGAAIPGILFSIWLIQLLGHQKMPLLIPVAYDLHPDWRVLASTIAFCGFTSLVFGLAPALQAAKPDLAASIRSQRSRLRNLLMVSQFSGSLTLLVILGLLSVGIQTTLGVQQGFDSRHLSLMALDPVRDGYSNERTTAFFDRLLDRVQHDRAVSAACLTETVPVSIGSARMEVTAPSAHGRQVLTAVRHVVGKDYFDTVGIPILLGHSFRREDEIQRTPSVIVSQGFVREFGAGSDLLGRQIEIGADQIALDRVLPGTFDYRQSVAASRGTVFTIVGVAGDVAEGLVVQKPPPVVYFPLRTADYARPAAQGITLIVRSAPGADGMGAVRRDISAIDTRIQPFHVRSMAEQIDEFTSPLNSASWTYRVVGIFGLLLSAVGLAGMTAYSVAQRTREIGIRMALGARRASVLGLVMREGAMLIAGGTAIGMACAWMVSRALAFTNASVGRVTSDRASDPLVLFGAPILLACVALAACYVPALNSIRIDPMVALREE